MQPVEAPSTFLHYGKGIYLTDCFSKATTQAFDQASLEPAAAPKMGVVFLVEVALGDMHRAYQPEPLLQMPPMAHSVYGVGQQKPDIRGLVDLRSTQDNFAVDENASDFKSQLFFNTGKIRANPDASGEDSCEQRFNEFVVFDPAQVKLKYAVLCEFYKAN